MSSKTIKKIYPQIFWRSCRKLFYFYFSQVFLNFLSLFQSLICFEAVLWVSICGSCLYSFCIILAREMTNNHSAPSTITDIYGQDFHVESQVPYTDYTYSFYDHSDVLSKNEIKSYPFPYFDSSIPRGCYEKVYFEIFLERLISSKP